MEKKDALHFAAPWVDYLNKDPELTKRISAKGPSYSLNGRELIALELEGLAKPYVLGLEKGKFYVKAKKARSPFVKITTSLDSFLKMATSVNERVLWLMLSDDVQFSVIKGAEWPNIITTLETLVALQEMLDKQPELIKAA